MSIVKEAFDHHARYVRRGFKRGREKTVGASEIGQCARKIWYHKHGAESDPQHIDGWGAARRGSVFESKFFLPAMRKKYGDNLLFTGIKQQRFAHKMLSATPDGLLVDQPRDLLAGLMVPDIGSSRCVVIECKTIDPRINLSEPKGEHVFQTIVQLGMFRMFTKYKPDYAVIIYTNASFYDDTVEFVVKFDQDVFERALKRANQIIISSTAGDLKPEGWIDGGDECKYCPFATSCRELRGSVPQKTDMVTYEPQFLSEMRDLAADERELHADIKAAETEHRAVQEKIKSRLRERGLPSIKTSDLSIVWSAVKGRPSYDWPGIKAAAAAAGIDLQQYETVGQPSDRLVVSVSKQDRLVTGRAVQSPDSDQ